MKGSRKRITSHREKLESQKKHLRKRKGVKKRDDNTPAQLTSHWCDVFAITVVTVVIYKDHNRLCWSLDLGRESATDVCTILLELAVDRDDCRERGESAACGGENFVEIAKEHAHAEDVERAFANIVFCQEFKAPHVHLFSVVL